LLALLGAAACEPVPGSVAPAPVAPALTADEEVLVSTVEFLPATGRSLGIAKVLDRARMTTRDEVVDLDTLEPVELVEARAEERRAFRAIHGVDDPALAEALDAAGEGAEVEAELIAARGASIARIAGAVTALGGTVLAERPNALAVRATREVLGYAPTISMDEGFERLASAVRAEHIGAQAP
jgi:nucleoside-diphosphate-sugar epimerase